MRGKRRTRAIVGGLFALFTAFVVVIVGLSDSAGATAGSTAGAAAGAVSTTPPDLAGTVVTEHSLTVAGVVRTYRTIAPGLAAATVSTTASTIASTTTSTTTSTTASTPLSSTARLLPLLVVLHGRGQQPWTAVRATGFLPLARRGQAVLVYPDGLARSWNAGSGCCGVAGTRGTPDTAFVAAVVAASLRTLPVDPARVYLVGYSNGGKLAWSLACGHAALFAAVATYGAVPLAPCTASAVLPSMMAVGVHDHVLPIGGDPRAHPTLPSARAAAGWLAARDRCTTPPVTSTEAGAVLQRWTSCRAGTEVDFAVYPGADHNWPAAVTGLMWTFLAARHSPAPGTRAPEARTPVPA